MFPRFSSPDSTTVSPLASIADRKTDSFSLPRLEDRLPSRHWLERFYITLVSFLRAFVLEQFVSRLFTAVRRLERILGMSVGMAETGIEVAPVGIAPHNFIKELHRALERGEFCLDYQPQVDVETGKFLGVESLVRWHHPRLGRISPADFIPIAEETGFIVPLGYWILEDACRQYQIWKSQGVPDFKLSVNLSIRQLKETNLVAQIQAILAETKMNPDFLELEITESFMANDAEAAIATLEQLKQLGLKMAINDFGTGYSSLSSLKNLPIQTLKIDKSFLDDLVMTSKNWVILQSIIDLGHRLQLKIRPYR